MSIISVFSLLGGIGMFLFGMNMLGDQLQNLAGNKMEQLLNKLTSSKIKGTLVGTLITGVIQSSAATSIIVLGFVNAGIMTLSQGIPVVFGANIGSTVTGQILRLGDLSSDNIILTILKPSSFAPVIICVGAFMLLFCTKKQKKSVAKILIGFGILFMGMTMMEQTMSSILSTNEKFNSFFTDFTNPLLGIIIGVVLTAAIQSSSASVGILQALAATGVVNYSIAIPVILGQNIGKSATVWIGSVGTNKKAKRVALIHTLFNLIGVIILGGILYTLNTIFHFSFWDIPLNRGGVANIHSVFNIVTTLILLPFTEKLIELSERIFKDKGEDSRNHTLRMLDDIFLNNPPIALEQCHKVLGVMEQTVFQNFKLSVDLHNEWSDEAWEEVCENEHFVDNAESAVNEYLMKVTALSLTTPESGSVTEMLNVVGNIERIGDYCESIAKVAEYNHSNRIGFSQFGKDELSTMTAATEDIINMAFTAYDKDSLQLARKVTPLEQVIDSLRELLKSRHIDRLQNNQCSMQAGLSYVELLTSFNRIANHCTNIAEHIIQKCTGRMAYDAHSHIANLDVESRMEYRAMVSMYEATYCSQYKEPANNTYYMNSTMNDQFADDDDYD